jgi:hypothetical protein
VRPPSICRSSDISDSAADDIDYKTTLGGKVPEQNRLAALSLKASIK